ncbi:MAG: type II secretion system F family protein [Thermoplasmatota archaeon]
MNGFQRLAFRWFGSIGERLTQRNQRLHHALTQAAIDIRPEVYLSTYLLIMTGAFFILLIPVILAIILSGAGLQDVPGTLLIVIVPAPLIAAALVYVVAFMAPELRANTRAREIDARLPYALNFIATMAAAGATPERIFASLGQQEVYGDVAREARMIRRDLQILGKDIVTALAHASDRSPSSNFQDLMQGAITTLTSGGDLTRYFINKSEQYMLQNRQDQKSFLESLGVLAESFVTVVVAAPLFLMVILSVMTTFGADANQMLVSGYLIVLVMLPLAQAGFAATIKFVTPEA